MTATPRRANLRNLPSSPYLLQFGLMCVPGVQAREVAAVLLPRGLEGLELALGLVGLAALALALVGVTRARAEARATPQGETSPKRLKRSLEPAAPNDNEAGVVSIPSATAFFEPFGNTNRHY